MKPPLYFAHGNGFPSPCYRQLINHLNFYFDCYYIDKVGHNPDFPVTDNWHALVDEVIMSIRSQVNEPVIAVGHSLGGVLNLLAAVQEPSLFRAVILLDSPLIGRLKSKVLKLSKKLGMIDHLTPAGRTKNRQQHWHTKEEVLSYLESKPLFRGFTKSCLHDYIEFGLRHDVNGYSLRFDPEIEYQIFRTIPHALWHYEGKLRVPSALIYGSDTRVIDRLDLRYMKKKHHILTYETPGTHMFPMEYPERTAHSILDVINQLGLSI